MVFKAGQIKWAVTDSVLEALILEANLIKKYQPYYNTREKDDKGFNYVCITCKKLPKVIIARGHNVQPSVLNRMYGPYTNGPQLREALKIIRPIFPFLDEKFKNNYRFYKQIDLVPDVSTPEGIKQYRNNIRNLKLFFSGKKKKIIQNLKRDMKEYAKVQQFERANEVKRQLFALQHINDVALLKYPYPASPYVGGGAKGGGGRIEAYDIAHLSGQNMVGVMTVVEDREVKKSEYKKFKIRTQKNINDIGALVEILERRLAHAEWNYPNLIVIDGGLGQKNAIKNIIEKAGLKIRVVSVVKDERHKPKDILGDEKIIKEHKSAILLANSEAHRFAIAYHKKIRGKNFLP